MSSPASGLQLRGSKLWAHPRASGDGISASARHSCLWSSMCIDPSASGARFVLSFPDGHWRTNSTVAIIYQRWGASSDPPVSKLILQPDKLNWLALACLGTSPSQKPNPPYKRLASWYLNEAPPSHGSKIDQSSIHISQPDNRTAGPSPRTSGIQFPGLQIPSGAIYPWRETVVNIIRPSYLQAISWSSPCRMNAMTNIMLFVCQIE
jgi:hypothetical protein